MAEAALPTVNAILSRPPQGRSAAKSAGQDESSDTQAFSRQLDARLQPQAKHSENASRQGQQSASGTPAAGQRQTTEATEAPDKDKPAPDDATLTPRGDELAALAALAVLPAALAAPPIQAGSAVAKFPGARLGNGAIDRLESNIPPQEIGVGDDGATGGDLGFVEARNSTWVLETQDDTAPVSLQTVKSAPAHLSGNAEVAGLSTKPIVVDNPGKLIPLDNTRPGSPQTPAPEREVVEVAALSIRAGVDAIKSADDGRGVLGTTESLPLPLTGVKGDEAAMLALQNVSRPAPHPESVAPRLPIHAPVGYDAWAGEVTNRVVWMTQNQEGTAELVLTPPQLGRIEVSVSVDGDKTSAQFIAATPAAREVLEQALPRLREALAQAGITLTDANVNTAGQQGQQSNDGRDGGSRRSSTGSTAAVESTISETNWNRRGEGLVDTFA